MEKPVKCAVSECKRRRDTRGYCMAHYNRWRRYGDPLGQPVKTPPCDARREALRKLVVNE